MREVGNSLSSWVNNLVGLEPYATIVANGVGVPKVKTRQKIRSTIEPVYVADYVRWKRVSGPARILDDGSILSLGAGGDAVFGVGRMRSSVGSSPNHIFHYVDLSYAGNEYEQNAQAFLGTGTGFGHDPDLCGGEQTLMYSGIGGAICTYDIAPYLFNLNQWVWSTEQMTRQQQPESRLFSFVGGTQIVNGVDRGLDDSTGGVIHFRAIHNTFTFRVGNSEVVEFPPSDVDVEITRWKDVEATSNLACSVELEIELYRLPAYQNFDLSSIYVGLDLENSDLFNSPGFRNYLLQSRYMAG